MQKGKLIILSGPSGVGKGSIRNVITKNKKIDLVYSISMTTRKPRGSEVDGVDYFFVDEKTFLDAIENDQLLEYANFVGNYYGTPRSEVQRLREEGRNVLIEIEVSGAQQVIEKIKDKDVITIFLLPPNMEELERRIRGRKTETEEKIQSRLKRAREEMAYQHLYDHVVINSDLEKASQDIENIIINHIESDK